MLINKRLFYKEIVMKCDTLYRAFLVMAIIVSFPGVLVVEIINADDQVKGLNGQRADEDISYIESSEVVSPEDKTSPYILIDGGLGYNICQNVNKKEENGYLYKRSENGKEVKFAPARFDCGKGQYAVLKIFFTRVNIYRNENVLLIYRSNTVGSKMTFGLYVYLPVSAGLSH